MIKKIALIAGSIVLLLFAYVVFNQFDAAPPDAMLDGKDVREYFGKANYDKSNGFYRLYSLMEPSDVDIESDEIHMKYRKAFDPKYPRPADVSKFRGFHGWRELRTHLIGEWTKPFPRWYQRHPFNPIQFVNSYLMTIKAASAEISKLEKGVSVFLQRYVKMLNSEIFEDFSQLEVGTIVPNYNSLLDMHKVFNAINLNKALNGDWDNACQNIIDQINLFKKYNKTHRVGMTKIISTSIIIDSIYDLLAMINHRDCPPSVNKMILMNLEDLSYDEYGNRNWFFTKGYMDIEFDARGLSYQKNRSFLNKLLFQKNRTERHKIEYIKKILHLDKTPPHKWPKPIVAFPNPKKGLFWWFQNPVGKSELSQLQFNAIRTIARSTMLKTNYDILRIAAELKLKADGTRPVQSVLADLETYNRLTDPCSGTAYKWNDDKQLLYSIGIDRVDNGGDKYDWINPIENSDYALPVVLYVKSEG